MINILSDLGLKTVPIVIENFVLNHSVDELVELSEDKSVINKNGHREGIVLRSKIEKYVDKLGRCSFKTINPKYLLKHGE